MKILFLNAYFFPEIISSTHLEQDLTKGLIDAGHEISVLCPIPTRGISADVAEKYFSVRSQELYEDRVHVKRFWAPKEGRNPVVRAFRYIWCNFRTYQIGKKYKDIDLIFSASTPPTQGYLSGKLSKKLKCPFIYWLQDIFPDSLVTTEMTSTGSLLWKIGRKIENYTYKNADKIIVISESFKKNIMEKGVPENKIEVVYNWIDEKEVVPIKREDNILFDTFNLDRNKFYVTYAGNLGNSQNIEIILKAAKELRKNSDINFVIFGDGSQKQNVVSIIKNEKLENVKLFPMQNYDLVSEVYSLGDASIITCKKGSGNGAFPSKTLSIMATETTVLTSFDLDSDLTNQINKAHCGICCDSDDTGALINAILKLYNDPPLCAKLGQNGRDFVYNHLNKQNALKKYINFISDSI